MTDREHSPSELRVVVSDATGARVVGDGGRVDDGGGHDRGPRRGETGRKPLARAGAIALTGLRGHLVSAEAVVAGGLSQIRIVGLPDATVREAADRIRSACRQSGFALPQSRVVVNLAPASIRKVGAGFDLPVALVVLVAAGHLSAADLDDVIALGEVGLDGRIRATVGTLPVAATAAKHRPRLFLAASEAASEAALADGLPVAGVDDLRHAVAVLTGEAPCPARPDPPATVARSVPDLLDVRGQHLARRGLEVAAAGGHHLLLLGPPGCGKSMLARRLPGILPPLSRSAALEVAAVQSIVGGAGARLDLRPPFRDPHHATSLAGLIGGGSGVARPGELSRAHRGVLFLDELLETPRATLDALRQPLETGEVVLVRSRSRVTYPAEVQLVAAANPCPCGHAGSLTRSCRCRPDQVDRYRARLSGPLLDRIDLHLELEPVNEDVLVGPPDGESSRKVAARVAEARRLAAARWADVSVGDGVLNRDAPPAAVRASVCGRAQRSLARTVATMGWSARSFDRCLRVARTIADLAGADVATREHVDEAVAYRLDTITGAA